MAVESGRANVAASPKGGSGSGSSSGSVPGSGSAGSPGWVVPAYVGGLALVYLAQRVIVAWEHVSLVVTVVGVLAAVAATVARFLQIGRAHV